MASSSSATTKKSLKAISDSMNQIEDKKSSLKKAFDDLQSQNSSLLTSFSLAWSDLDSHFTAVHASLREKFGELETLASQSQSKPESAAAVEPEPEKVSPSVAPRPELVAFCEGMDGIGLRKYVSESAKVRSAVKEELPGALRMSPDAASMVLDAMEGFYGEGLSGKGDFDAQLSNVRRSCVLLLEMLMAAGASVGDEVRERASVLAAEWRRKMSTEEDCLLESQGFLHLVAAFGLGSEFNSGELVDSFVVVAKYRQAIELCRKIELGDQVEDIIQKLIDNGKQILAIRFCFEFERTEKFPPVTLLQSFLKESKKAAKKICKDGNNSLRALNEATAKEVSALRSVIKVIKEHNLEPEYPPESLEKQVEQLEKQRLERKRQPNHQQKQQSAANKRSRTDAPHYQGHNPVPKTLTAANFTVPFYPHSHLPPRSTGRSTDGLALPYGYAYGPVGTQVGVPGNSASVSSSSHMYSSSFYERPNPYAGYGLRPEYHTSYYPK